MIEEILEPISRLQPHLGEEVFEMGQDLLEQGDLLSVPTGILSAIFALFSC
jgi:hypothetical protein